MALVEHEDFAEILRVLGLHAARKEAPERFFQRKGVFSGWLGRQAGANVRLQSVDQLTVLSRLDIHFAFGNLRPQCLWILDLVWGGNEMRHFKSSVKQRMEQAKQHAR